MKQQLYLLRHAEAEPWNLLGNDFSRGLSSSGAHHAQLVSAWLLKTLTQADTVLCSPAKRTRETLAPILSGWSRLLASTDYIDSMYNASLDLLLTVAEDAFSFSERVLMVGHNPGFEQMLMASLCGNQRTSLEMSPGNLAIIEFPSGFKRDACDGNLLHLIRRKDLSEHG